MSADHIAQTLRADILSGRIRPGSKLKQVDLADRFGLSRIPVRDALAQLARDGLIEHSPNRGATVPSLSQAQIEELFDLRVMLECDCLARAMPQMGPEALAQLDHALKRSDLEAGGADWAAGDALFHEVLYAPSGRDQQMALITRLRQRCQIHIAAYPQLPKNTARWLQDHHAIVAACRAGDINTAVTRLTGHLRGAEAALLKRMG